MSKTKETEKVNYKANLLIYWSIIKKYKLFIFWVLLISIITELTYTADKFIFKLVVDNGAEYVAKTLSYDAFVDLLINLSIIFFLLIVVRFLAKWFFIHFVNIFESKAILDIKRRFFNHILHLSHDFHTTHKTGSLISRLIRGGSSMERMTDLIIFNLIPLILQIIIVSTSLIYFNAMSVLVIFLIVISFLLYSIIFNNIQQSDSVKYNIAEDIEKANISDTFTNIDSVKYFGKENEFEKRFAKLSEITRIALLKKWHYSRWLDSGQSIILSLGLFMLILFPLIEFLHNNITLGTLVFIYTLWGNIVGPLFGFVGAIRNFYRSMADFEALFQYEKIDNDIKDKSDAPDLKIKHGMIEIKNVTFSYKKRKIFKNFSLMIPQNKRIALVGPSGSGKSTLIKLIYRFYDPSKGNILIDGKNIKNFKQESLRSELSIVPQECVLFDDTIYNNIAFSNPNTTRQQVFRAIKFAQLDNIINKFPNKEETIVGERGVRLSGGEKQRVSIARAILADKKILILDEATSSLDSETEHEIQKDMEKLMQGRTSMIIAHRLSTIMHADIIVVLEHGKIVQIGTHKELSLKSGLYNRLWNLQRGGYIL